MAGKKTVALRTEPAGGASGASRRRPKARRGEGERLREEIVDTACRLLAETGDVSELSLRAVARAVGVATTSIYLHFRDRDELVLAVKKRYLDEFGEALAKAADAAGEVPLDRARARAHRYVGYGLAHPGRYWVMFSSEMLPTHLSPTVAYLGEEVFGQVRNEVATVVGPHRDATMIATHVWTALHGIVTLRTVRKGFPWPDLDQQIDHLIGELLAGGGPAPEVTR